MHWVIRFVRADAQCEQVNFPAQVRSGADEDCDGTVDGGPSVAVRVRAKSLCPHVSAARITPARRRVDRALIRPATASMMIVIRASMRTSW